MQTQESYVEETDVEQTDTRETGVIKWFNPELGYGFIIRDSGPEIFVHYSALPLADPPEPNRTLPAWTRVSFKVENSPKGPVASKVKVIDSE